MIRVLLNRIRWWWERFWAIDFDLSSDLSDPSEYNRREKR